MHNRKKSKEILGANVLACRERMGWSQGELAKKTKVMDQTTVSRIERRAYPTTVKMLDGLADAFGVEPWHLLTENLDFKNPPALALTDNQKKIWASIEKSAIELGLKQ